MDEYYKDRLKEIKKIVNDENISQYEKNNVLQCESYNYLFTLKRSKNDEYYKKLMKIFNKLNENTF